jgi:hypothetical protein
MIIYVIYNSEKSKKIKGLIDVNYTCIILNLQIAWLIYGNTFQYSDEGYQCKLLNSDTKQLWILMQVILCYGYLQLFGWLFVVLAFTCIIIANIKQKRQ